MIIGSKQRLYSTGNSLDINIANENIANVDFEKLIDLYIDKNLNLNEQIEKNVYNNKYNQLITKDKKVLTYAYTYHLFQCLCFAII